MYVIVIPDMPYHSAIALRNTQSGRLRSHSLHLIHLLDTSVNECAMPVLVQGRRRTGGGALAQRARLLPNLALQLVLALARVGARRLQRRQDRCRFWPARHLRLHRALAY